MTEVDILDDLFHGCAWAAFVELAIACGGFPDQEATRQLAFRYYEEALAEKNSTGSGRSSSPSSPLGTSASVPTG